MKILITSDWYVPVVNGVVTSILNLTQGLTQLGHEVRILTLSGTMHSYREGRVSYIGSVGVGLVYPNARLRTALSGQLVRELIEWQPDVVHSQCEFSTFFLARKIAQSCNAPLVHTYHTVYEDFTHYFSPSVRAGKRLAAFFSRMLLAKTDAVIAPTAKTADMLVRYGVEKPIAVIPTGLDWNRLARPVSARRIQELRRILGIGLDEVIFLYVGRLAKEKNMEELFVHLRDDAPAGSRLLLVGDGPHRRELELLAQDMGIAHRLIFTGMVPPSEIADYYAIGDIFVTASQSETQGLTYMEAMACGLPLLCKYDSCLDGVIASGKNGFTYRTAQEFADMAEALYASRAMRAKVGAAARSSVWDAYSIERFAARVLRVYQSQLAAPIPAAVLSDAS